MSLVLPSEASSTPWNFLAFPLWGPFGDYEYPSSESIFSSSQGPADTWNNPVYSKAFRWSQGYPGLPHRPTRRGAKGAPELTLRSPGGPTVTILAPHAHSYSKLLFSQSYVLLFWDPTDCSPPGSSVHRIFQARMLEWVAISPSRGSFWPRDQIWVSCVSALAGGFFITEARGKSR